MNYCIVYFIVKSVSSDCCLMWHWFMIVTCAFIVWSFAFELTLRHYYSRLVASILTTEGHFTPLHCMILYVVTMD